MREREPFKTKSSICYRILIFKKSKTITTNYLKIFLQTADMTNSY